MKQESILFSLADLFFPRHCAACGCRLAPGEQFVCPECMLGLPWERYHDWVHNSRTAIRDHHPSIQRMGALMCYTRDNSAAHIVHEFKFHRHYELGAWMGRLAVERLRETGLFDGVEVLVPIPLTKSRQRHRGFNQAEKIADGMAAELGIEVRTDVLRRIRNIESQTHFRFEQRLTNAKGIFALTAAAPSLAGRHVMIVDDVMTTGRTMLSAIETLETISDIRLSTFAWSWIATTKSNTPFT